MFARMVFVKSDAKRCAEQRRHRHRPADQPHHAQHEPDSLRGFTRLELPGRLRADLAGERRLVLWSFLWLVIHVEKSRSDAEIPFPISSLPGARFARARPGSETPASPHRAIG